MACQELGKAGARGRGGSDVSRSNGLEAEGGLMWLQVFFLIFVFDIGNGIPILMPRMKECQIYLTAMAPGPRNSGVCCPQAGFRCL